MKHFGSHIKDVYVSRLIRELAQGWTPSHCSLAEELIDRWSSALEASIDSQRVRTNTLSFVTYLSQIHLRSMDQVFCWMVGGQADLSSAIQDISDKISSPTELPFILALSSASYEQVMEKLSNARRVILSAQEVEAILRSDQPLELLKRFILQQIPRRTLIPYNIFLPAQGAMFFGRWNEIHRLLDEHFTSFAIAGPARIGKTSLLLQYKAQVLRKRARAKNIFSINLYDATEEGMARTVAMQIDASSRSDRIDSRDLVNFFTYQAKRFGAPLELLLDEVDGVCQSEAFNSLAEAAKLGLCRLVLCGRGILLRTMLSSQSPLDCRLELIQMEPLDEISARDLFLEPLKDLGFQIDQPESLSDQILSLSGRQPHLIQYFGKRLAELAIGSKPGIIAVDSLEVIKNDFLTAEFFIKPLMSLADPKTRFTGLLLAADHNHQSFTLAQVQQIANREGLHLDLKATHDICTDLVINNVLAWNNGSFALANEGLHFFTQQAGYMDAALEEARQMTRANHEGFSS